jgi:hypothetical protein
MYLNQFRGVEWYDDKTAMTENVIGVPQNMECVQGAIGTKKEH